MIFDQTLLLSDNQAVTATAASTNVIDTGAYKPVLPNGVAGQARDQGKGTKVPLLIQVTEAFAGLTTLTVNVQVSATNDFTTATTVQTTGAVPLVALVAGNQFHIDVLPRGTTQRYIRLQYVVAGTGTAGKIKAGVVAAVQEA